MSLMIINAHDCQRFFPQASLIILSVPPALVHQVPICVSWRGDGREGDQEVLVCVGCWGVNRLLLLLMSLMLDEMEMRCSVSGTGHFGLTVFLIVFFLRFVAR